MSNHLTDLLESELISLLEFELETIANLARNQSVGQRRFARHIDKAQNTMTFISLFGLVKEKHKNMKVGIIAKKFNHLVINWVEHLRDEMEVV